MRDRTGRLLKGAARVWPWALLPAVAIISILSFLGEQHWSFELLSHFRMQFIAVSALSTLTFLVMRRWRLGLAAAGLCLAHLFPVFTYMSHFASEAPDTGRDAIAEVRLFYFNMRHRHADHEAFLANVRRQKPGILLLTEVDPSRRDDLFARLAEQYQHHLHTDGSGPFDMSLFSRHVLRKSGTRIEGGMEWPILQAAICDEGAAGCTELLAVHAPRPGPQHTALRNTVFAEVAARAARTRKPVVVVGDFNSTPWSPAFRRMLRRGGLKDGGAAGAAFNPTWISRLPLLGLGIDHVLTGNGMMELDRRIGASFGSDHHSIQVRLRVESGSLAGGAAGS